MMMWIEVITSTRVSTIAASEGAAFAFGLSSRRRTATLVTLVNATSMIDITRSAEMNKAAIRNSVPLSIGTCAADDVQVFSFARRRFRGHIPSNAAVRAK